jgi:hypothetical protein
VRQKGQTRATPEEYRVGVKESSARSSTYLTSKEQQRSSVPSPCFPGKTKSFTKVVINFHYIPEYVIKTKKLLQRTKGYTFTFAQNESTGKIT